MLLCLKEPPPQDLIRVRPDLTVEGHGIPPGLGEAVVLQGVQSSLVMITDDKHWVVDAWDLAGKDLPWCIAWALALPKEYEVSRVTQILGHRVVTEPLRLTVNPTQPYGSGRNN